MVESPKAIAILHPPKLRRFPMPQLIRVIDDFTSFQQEEEASPFPAMSDVGNVALHADNGVNAALFSGGGNGCFSSNYSPQFIPNPPSYSSQTQTQTQTQTLDNTWYLNATEPPTAGLVGAPSQFPAPEGNVNAEDTLPSLVSGSEDIDEVSDMEEMRSFYRQPEKKHRLTADQVRRLETSFDVDNKLEPHRKSRLAKELGLEPKQVAIWFQNRRARFKSKRLEKDYYKLKANYDSLKAGYDSLLKERERLRNVVSLLSNEPRMRDTPRSNPGSMTGSMGSVHLKEYALTGRMVMAPGFGQGGAGSMRSGVIDYESPRSVDWNKQVVGPGLASAGYENPLRGPGAPPMGSEFGYVQPEGDDFGSAFGENSEFVPPGMDDQSAYWPYGLKF